MDGADMAENTSLQLGESPIPMTNEWPQGLGPFGHRPVHPYFVGRMGYHFGSTIQTPKGTGISSFQDLSVLMNRRRIGSIIGGIGVETAGEDGMIPA